MLSSCRKTVYIAVRSTLKYGSIIWDPYPQKDIGKNGQSASSSRGVRDIWGLNFPWNLKIQCHRTIIKEIPNISPKANFADRTGLCRDHIKDMYLILWKKPFEDTCHNSWLQALSVEKLLPFRLFTLLSVIWGPKLAHENIALVQFFGPL